MTITLTPRYEEYWDCYDQCIRIRKRESAINPASLLLPLIYVLIGFMIATIDVKPLPKKTVEKVYTQTATITLADTDPIDIPIMPEIAVPEVAMIEAEPVFVRQDITPTFDILQPSGFTAEDLSYALSSDSHKAMLPYVDTIMAAEEKYGVNALYLMCTLGLESGWARYEAAENNIAGWTDSNYEFIAFDSIDDCIMCIAENLSTVYKEKVGSELEAVCWRYCPVDGYLETLMDIMIERQDKMLAR